MKTRTQFRFGVAAIAAVVLALLSVSVAGARIRCTNVTGTFATTVFGGPECTSPIGLCTTGTLSGDLSGTHDMVFDSLVPAGDPYDPTLMVYTGHSVITLERGQLFTEDTGFVRLNSTGPSPSQTTHRVVDGTRRFNNVTGGTLAIGELDLFSGNATGTYNGEFCHSN